MSRFDDFAKSSARGRGLFGAFRSVEAEVTDSGISRRDLMKKAGIVGGATIAGSALIQSVGAPAFAASCGNPSDTSQMCGGQGTPLCPRCGPGASCDNGADCVSAVCTEGTCAEGETVITCTADSDCVPGTGYCSGGVCSNPPVGLAGGAACHASSATAASAQCSGAGATCTSGTCQSGVGGSCSPSAPCAGDNVCTDDVCVVPLPAP